MLQINIRLMPPLQATADATIRRLSSTLRTSLCEIQHPNGEGKVGCTVLDEITLKVMLSDAEENAGQSLLPPLIQRLKKAPRAKPYGFAAQGAFLNFDLLPETVNSARTLC